MKACILVILALCAAACSSGSSDSSSSSDGSGGSGGASGSPDADRDGFAVSADCNDNDATVWRTLSVFADADRDGVGAGSAVSICAGSTVSAAYAATPTDCAENNAAIHTLMPYAARDIDGDTYLAASAGSVCSNGTALPPSYFATAGSAAPDCDDMNGTLWRLAQAYDDVDRDGIGHGALRSLCLAATTPAGLAESSFDCDPLDATKWRMVSTYIDVDGDGVGSGALQRTCMGSATPAGSSLLGFDPLDTTSNPTSASISDFDLNFPSLIVEETYDDGSFP